MSQNLEILIGNLVTAGYMATWHEQTIYLHDSQGNRWAEIDPLGINPKITVGGKTLIAANDRDVLTLLAEVAA